MVNTLKLVYFKFSSVNCFFHVLFPSSEIKVVEADMLDLPFSDGCFDVVIEKGTMVNSNTYFNFPLHAELSICSFYLWWILSWSQHVVSLLVEVTYTYNFLVLKEVLFVNSGDPWNPRPETVSKVMAMLEGVHRVLKPDGIFLSISFGQVTQIKTYDFSCNICGIILAWDLYLLQPHFRRPIFNAPQFSWSVEWITFGDGFHYFFYILRKVSLECWSFSCFR